ncbi:MAG: hypothetical protein JNL11_07965 [Bdellovibrionaceae bacterium]|nr:hypothetical protein [Pseudobdellovibrionaceae bacterium]
MKTLVTTFTIFFGIQCLAGFIVEPFLGYNTGSTKLTATTGEVAKSTNSGLDYGLRLGYLFGQSFWTAAEYTGGSGKDKGSSSEEDYARTATGILVGYKVNKYNFWAGYGISDKVTYKLTDAEIYYSGTNMKFGFGQFFANHVAVNVELIIPKYTKFGSGSRELNIADEFKGMDVTYASISVSFPFGYGK